MSEKVEHEIARMSGLIESLTNEMRSSSRAESGDTRAMLRNPACRNILSVMQAWLWETDSDHKISYISPQFESSTGCDSAFFLNKTREEISKSLSLRDITARRHIAMLERRLEFKAYRYGVHIPRNGVKWFVVSGKPRYEIGTSRFLGYWGVGQDCTKENESAFNETRRISEFGQALDALDVSILILDSEYRISYRNERWLALHSAVDKKVLEIGSRYEDYLRESVVRDLFPGANRDMESFISERVRQNMHPPIEPFFVERQDGILLSIKIAKLANGSTLIASSDVTKWN